MDALSSVGNNAPFVQAFTQLLLGQNSDKVLQGAKNARPLYRRPAAANPPQSFVVREAKEKKRRLAVLSGEYHQQASKQCRQEVVVSALLHSKGQEETAVDEEVDRALRAHRIRVTHRQPLSLAQWKLLIKRRRRLRLRRKQSAQRRRARRWECLRAGKKKAPCLCCGSQGEAKKSKRIETVWLPSHQVLRRRCTFKIAKVSIPRAVAHSVYYANKLKCARREKVRIAIAATRNTKVHRSLQRWVDLLTTTSHTGHTRRKREQTVFNERAPPRAFLTDLSHYCMYKLLPSTGVSEVAEAQSAFFFSKLQFVPCSEGSSTHGFVYDATDGRRRETCAVVHGHMWSQHTNGAQDESDPLYVSANRTIVPAVIVMLPIATGANEVKQRVLFLLFAPKPLFFSPQCLPYFSSIELTSLWSPCAAARSVSTMFEWWSLGEYAAAVTQQQEQQQQQQQQASQSHERRPLHLFHSLLKEKNGRVGAKKKASTHSTLCLVFPSLPPNDMATHANVVSSCVQRIVCFSSLRDENGSTIGTGYRAPTGTEASLYEAHFSLSRRFFSRLLQKSHLVPSGAVAAHPVCLKSSPTTRVLGEVQREELLLLLGRPSYPGDFVSSWKDSPSGESVSLREEVPAVITHNKRARRARTNGGSSLSLSCIIKYHGTLSNAAHRVMFRSSSSNKKLPSQHCQRGALLLKLVVHSQRNSQIGPAYIPPRLSVLGVVTTSSPLYIRRMGCQAVLVWCCLDHRNITKSVETDKWSDLYRQEPPTDTKHTNTRWLLASRQNANVLLDKVEGLQLLKERLVASDCSAKGAKQSRHMGQFAQALRSVEAVLCSNELAAFVVPTSMYI